MICGNMELYSKSGLMILSLVFVFVIVQATEDHQYHSEDMGPCQSCKVYVDSFERGAKRIEHHPGDLQARLNDIWQGLCEDPRSRTKCLETARLAWPLLNSYEPPDPYNHQDFFRYVCIDKLEVCCPKDHYGRECLACPGAAGAGGGGVCGGRGRCRGAGTRRGNGSCLCQPGFAGDLCTDCSTGYYNVEENSEMACKRCHYSCAGGCRGGTPRDCVACRPGFVLDAEEGCHDINECNDVSICTNDEYCVNALGSYKCMPCDKACEGCYGDSIDMCRKCAAGYKKKGSVCVNGREDEELRTMNNTRYLIYLGLLVATGVLYPRSPAFAAATGALTLSYIAMAEYYCHMNQHPSLLDLSFLNI